jgi:hypothetical protein
MSFDSFFSDALATVVGGSILTLLFFWIREKIFPLPRIDGRWYFEMRTTSTSYKPYEGMVLRYVAMAWLEGYRVEGTAEKIHEHSSTGIRDFVGQHRTRSVIDGLVHKKYFGTDHVFLHVVETGHGRESTNFFRLKVTSGGKLCGRFSSMVADQEGQSVWQRTPFPF